MWRAWRNGKAISGMRVGQSRRRDKNEPEIVQELERCGIRVHRISSPGFADLVTYSKRHGLLLLEVKSRTGRQTAQQVKHTTEGWPVQIVRTVEDALQACGVTHAGRAEREG